MAAGTTYTPIATYTLGSNGTITFSSIPSTYTDLRLVINGGITNTGWDTRWRINSDTGANYSQTRITGDGSAAASGRTANATKFANNAGSGTNVLETTTLIDFLNYSNTTTYKTCLSRGNDTATALSAIVGLWNSTSAINSIFIYCGASNDGVSNLYAGTTATLYGIAAA